ncbi:hypothetical protein LB505_007517 [Fusarium chuoi]|nr:hypothetical protein LB505_007517 [Fusarium chuoi]
MVGILNGAFTIGTLDAITHMAEEAKNPKKDLPRAIFLYISIGGVYALAFAMVLGYAISDLSVLQGNSNTFPLAAFGMPFDATMMNYNSVILCGLCFLITVWWFLSASKHYPGPTFHQVYNGDENKEAAS